MTDNNYIEYSKYVKLKSNKNWKPIEGFKVKLNNGAIGEYILNGKEQLVFRITKGVKDTKKIREKAVIAKKKKNKNNIVNLVKNIYLEEANKVIYHW